MNGLLAFLGEREIFVGDMIAASLGNLGHASWLATRLPITRAIAGTRQHRRTTQAMRRLQ
jgi:hypothetical protein